MGESLPRFVDVLRAEVSRRGWREVDHARSKWVPKGSRKTKGRYLTTTILLGAVESVIREEHFAKQRGELEDLLGRSLPTAEERERMLQEERARQRERVA